MFDSILNMNEMKYFFGELNDVNYYNQAQNLVRIKIDPTRKDPSYYDFYLMESVENPNPADHYVLLATTDQVLNKGSFQMKNGDDRLAFPPGYKNTTELTDSIPFGFVWLISKKVSSKTTSYNNTQSGMHNNEAKDPTKQETIKYSLSPSLNKDYTNTGTESDVNPNVENIGVFVTENSILLKSAGGAIMLGPQGISMMGEKYESSSKGQSGMMADNPFSGWFPSTMMTVPLAIEMIPNLNLVLAVGTAGRTLSKAMPLLGKAATSLNNVLSKVY